MRTFAPLALLALACGGGSTVPTPPEAAPAPPSAITDGVSVEGAWTIEVRDPDGTVVTHRELHNALVDPANLLGRVLGHQLVMGRWAIRLGGDACSATEPCELVDRFSTPTGIQQATMDLPAQETGRVTMHGTATAQRAGSVTSVATVAGACPVGTTTDCPSLAVDGSVHELTSAPVDPPVHVEAGQQVFVKVDLTFASAS